MAYRLEYLSIADLDLAEAEDCLFEHSPAAYDKFRDAVKKLETLLVDNPFMHQVYEDKPYFRRMNLP